VWFLLTDVSEECIAFIIRVKRITELGTMLAVTLMMYAIPFSVTSVFKRATQYNIPEDGVPHN
jgi:hypothetical protein